MSKYIWYFYWYLIDSRYFEREEKCEDKKIVVFGLGAIFKTFLNVYDSSKAEIIALSDNKIKESVYKKYDPAKKLNWKE